MAEKKRYGMLEMDAEQKKRLDKLIARKPFHHVDPEIKEMVLAKRKGMPRIIDIHTHPYTKIGWRSLGKFRMHLEKYLYKRDKITPEQVTEMAKTYLKDDEATIVVVGDRKVIEEQVKAYGVVEK